VQALWASARHDAHHPRAPAALVHMAARSTASPDHPDKRNQIRTKRCCQAALRYYICLFKMRRTQQIKLPLKESFGWGGKRRNAGRKPKGEKAGVSHQSRPRLASRHPIHVTTRLVPEVGSLRTKDRMKLLKRCFRAGCKRPGFRLVHWSVQGNHMHWMAEAKDKEALAKGVKGLEVRIARAINARLQRKGGVFADRYHARVLKTPREVRAALAYVLLNARHHARPSASVPGTIDLCSSGMYFDGWRERVPRQKEPDTSQAPPLAAAATWLLQEGWRKCGLLSLAEVPG